MARRRSNVRSRPRRTRRRISRRVRRGGTAKAEALPEPPPGAKGFGTFGEVTPADDDPNALPAPVPAEPVMGVGKTFGPDLNSDDENAYGEAKALAAVEDDIKDEKLVETNSDDFDMIDEANKTPEAPEPEAPAPEDAKPETSAWQFPSFGKREKEPPIFKDLEPPPEAVPVAAVPALPPALPALPALPMPPDDLMERPRDAYLLGEQKVATRFPDFGLKKKRKSRRMRRPTKKKRRVTKAQTLRKQITKKSREIKSLRKKLSKRRTKKLTKRSRKRLTKKMNDIKRRLAN